MTASETSNRLGELGGWQAILGTLTAGGDLNRFASGAAHGFDVIRHPAVLGDRNQGHISKRPTFAAEQQRPLGRACV